VTGAMMMMFFINLWDYIIIIIMTGAAA